MTIHAPNIEAVLAHAPVSAPARLVHLALAAVADERGHVETTLHSLEHLTGMQADWVASTLGQNELRTVLIPAAVAFAGDVVIVDLLRPVPEPVAGGIAGLPPTATPATAHTDNEEVPA